MSYAKKMKVITCGKLLVCGCGIINAGAICICPCEDGKTKGACRATKGCVFRAYDRTALVESVTAAGAGDVKLKKFLEKQNLPKKKIDKEVEKDEVMKITYIQFISTMQTEILMALYYKSKQSY